MQIKDTLSPEVIFERTHKGRAAVIGADSTLSPQARQLLLMLTGYTPIGDLAALLHLSHPRPLVDELLAQGLIRPVEACKTRQRGEWFGRQIGSSQPYPTQRR